MNISIVKLGGSIITEKGKERVFNEKNMIRVATEIANSKKQCIIVHGAGSFGHPIAKKYNLVAGNPNWERNSHFEPNLIATSEARYWLNYLHNKFIYILNKYGIPTFSLPVSSSGIEIENNNISLPVEQLEIALKNGFFPVLYGDIILSRHRGFTVISGDKIISLTSKALHLKFCKIDQVVFCSDVDGIYRENPMKNPNAELIKEIQYREMKDIINLAEDSTYDDVTGGMKGKIEQINVLLENKINVKIVNSNKNSRLENALMNSKFIGSSFYC